MSPSTEVAMADIMDEILRIFYTRTAKRNIFSLDLPMLQKINQEDAVVLSGALVDFLSFVYCREKGPGDMGRKSKLSF
jgi:hypothetical protein